MLLPRFTLRTFLVLVSLSAILFLVVGMAYRGEQWAWGVTIGVVSLAITSLVHAAWFGIVWIFAQVPLGDPVPPVPLHKDRPVEGQ